jgi:hypothetical protein
MPALPSPLIDVPAGKLAGALAANGSRCCLRGWLARVPDLRSRLDRWHPLVFVLARASARSPRPGTTRRISLLSDAAMARAVERDIQRDGLVGEPPLLNPLRRTPKTYTG